MLFDQTDLVRHAYVFVCDSSRQEHAVTEDIAFG